MNSFNSQRLLKIILLISIILGVYFGLKSDLIALLRQGDFDAIQSLLNENKQLTLLMTFLFMVIQNSITLFPLLALVSVNLLLFGFLNGYVWSLVTSVAASMLVFLLTRYYLQDFLMKKIPPNIKDKMEAHGFVFVFIVRIFPFLPSSVINMGAAVSSISFAQFSLATLLGNGIFIFFLSLIPLGIMTIEVENVLLALFAVAILVVLYFRRQKKKKKSPFRQ